MRRSGRESGGFAVRGSSTARKRSLARLADSASERAACSAASRHSRSCSCRRSSVTSRKTRTTPTILSSWSLIGAALSAIGRSVPSRAIRAV